MVKNKREHHKSDWFNKFYKSYWFILWFFIYGILFYLSTLLVTALGIQSYYFQILFIGVIISIFSRAISSSIHHYPFKLNFNLFIWALVYILLLFGLKFIVSYITINQWFTIIIISLAFIVFVHLIKKIKFKTLSIIVIIVSLIFGAFLLFNEKQFNFSRPLSTSSGLSDNSDLNSNPISTQNTECTLPVYAILGSKYTVVYGITRERELVLDSIGFWDSQEGFDSVWRNPTYYGINTPSDTTERELIKNNLRLGENTGENIEQLYGNLIYRYNYSNKVVSPNGTIIGTNRFEIEVNIPDISKYTYRKDPRGLLFYIIDIPTEDITKIKDCGILE